EPIKRSKHNRSAFLMFSQYAKDFSNRNRESTSSVSSQEPGISLFYSVPTLPAEAEIRESISLQTSRVLYNQYDDDDEYQDQGSEPDATFLTTVPLTTHQTTQVRRMLYRLLKYPSPIILFNIREEFSSLQGSTLFRWY
ncbi:3845_t:CDS:1, partial [Cetraspora pellucida]